MRTRCIDLNCDMGERPGALEDGSEEELMKLITSANIACGYHAGDPTTMERTVKLASKYGVGVGAHPGYADKENFGRVSINLPTVEISRIVYDQVKTLWNIARKHHAELVHVKPHGAMYHDAARDQAVAAAIAEGVARWSKEIVFVGLAGSPMLETWKAMGFRVAAEAFADRTYESDGSLLPRQFKGAVITDPAEAARQALKIVNEQRVTTTAGSEISVIASTLCVHSDNPQAIAIVRMIMQKFAEHGITISGMKISPF